MFCVQKERFSQTSTGGFTNQSSNSGFYRNGGIRGAQNSVLEIS